MNERIKQCWDQAVNNDDTWDGQVRFMEKFAELIVRECADAIELNSMQISKRGIGEIRTIVKKHFGVEE